MLDPQPFRGRCAVRARVGDRDPTSIQDLMLDLGLMRVCPAPDPESCSEVFSLLFSSFFEGGRMAVHRLIA